MTTLTEQLVTPVFREQTVVAGRRVLLVCGIIACSRVRGHLGECSGQAGRHRAGEQR